MTSYRKKSMFHVVSCYFTLYRKVTAYSSKTVVTQSLVLHLVLLPQQKILQWQDVHTKFHEYLSIASEVIRVLTHSIIILPYKMWKVD